MFMPNDPEDKRSTWSERIICPNCGKPVHPEKMNVCYIARCECLHCGAALLIEGDTVTVEENTRD
jgi:hypothetical protein